MVKLQKKYSSKKRGNQAKNVHLCSPNKIGADTAYGYCNQRLTAFGGLLGFEKFFDLIKFEEAFLEKYARSSRKTKLGDFRMIKGILFLLFVGFQRIGQFEYIQEDSIICGLQKVDKLPDASTFWRYVNTLTINQAKSVLEFSGILRGRAWQLCGLVIEKVTIDIDTTVTTVYGDIEGSRKGHNTKHRGKKGLRPVLAYISQTKEYLCGKQRRGTTMSMDETADLIDAFDRYLPECVQYVLVRADGEFTGWESVKKCKRKGYDYIIGARAESPVFAESGWYRHGEHEYNEVEYQPNGWEEPCRFVCMRIKEENKNDRQLKIFDQYMYRTFMTNLDLRPHNVIERYDDRAACENLIGESQREGISAIPSRKFMTNYAFFQIVMLAYNIWRWYELIISDAMKEKEETAKEKKMKSAGSYASYTIRTARLRILLIAAKIIHHANQGKALYSIFDCRAPELIRVMKWLDMKRSEDTVFSDCSRLTALKTAG